MKRREFIAGIGGAVVWPFAVRAQQRPLPLVGNLSPGTPEQTADYVSAFRRGLNEAGLVEGIPALPLAAATAGGGGLAR
jgi:putative tryptophan/tyrosine transport system substrate-binding protein